MGYLHAIMDGKELPVRIVVKESDYKTSRYLRK